MLCDENQRNDEHHSSQECSKASFCNDRIGEDSGVVQRVADCYIAVQSHEHEHSRLHPREGMDEEHLYKTVIKSNFFEMKPEDAQGFGDCTRAHDKVC